MSRPSPRVGAAVVAALLAGCGGAPAPAATPTLAAAPVQAGSAAPPISGTTVHGAPVSLAAWRGSVVVVLFWASWCAPCNQEQPQLDAVARETQPRGVHFLGVAVNDDRASVLAYLQRYGVPYDTLVDSDGAAVARYGIAGPPTTVVVDPSGNVTGVLLGTSGPDDLRALIREAGAPSA